MINKGNEAIVAVGAIMSEIPTIDEIDISKIKTGNKVSLKDDIITIF
jgi:uncharacterized protein